MSILDFRGEFPKLVKYALVGISNTLLTFVVFLGLRFCGVGLDLSNFLGYTIGIINSFVWNKLWVFHSKGKRLVSELVLFFLGAFLCWGVQWLAFRCLLNFFSEELAQLIGICVYTSLNYIYNRFLTFANK